MKAKIMSLYPFDGKTTDRTVNCLSFKELQVVIKNDEQNWADIS